VRDSHYAVNDAAVTFFILCVVFASLKIWQTSSWKWYFLAGIGLGLGFATKYTAIIAILPILVAHFYTLKLIPRDWRTYKVKYLVLVLLTTVIVALIASPFFLLSTPRVVHDVIKEPYSPSLLRESQIRIPDLVGVITYYLKSMRWGLGIPMMITLMAGIILGFIRRKPKDLILLSFPIIFLFILIWQNIYFARLLIPAIPPLVILGAKGVVEFVSRLSQKKRIRNPIGITIVIVLILTLLPLINSIRSNFLLTQTDTRTLASQWIEQNISEGSRIAIDWPVYSSPLSSTEKRLPGTNKIFDLPFKPRAGLHNFSIDWYRQQDYDFLIVSSFITEDNNEQKEEFYQNLHKELELVKEIGPSETSQEIPFIFDEFYGPAISLWRRDRPGPTIRIYRVN
jgi:hypothetical protein